MHRQPYAWRIGGSGLDTVPFVSWKEGGFAFRKGGQGAVIEREHPSPLNDRNPFVPVLVVPASRRRGMPGGDDSLHRHIAGAEKDVNVFTSRCWYTRAVEKVDDHCSPLCPDARGLAGLTIRDFPV